MNNTEAKIAVEEAIIKLSHEAERHWGSQAGTAALASIPYIGGAISDLLTSKARERLAARTLKLAQVINERISQVEEVKIDKEFFRSEEFQTLLALAWEQLQTTHDDQKLKAIGTALANGGVHEFRDDERKELFLRILRDLTKQHIIQLQELLPRNQFAHAPSSFWPIKCDLQGETLGAFQTLASHGLIEEYFDTKGMSDISFGESIADAKRIVRELASRTPKRCFRIHQFGRDFLKFIGLDSAAPAENQ